MSLSAIREAIFFWSSNRTAADTATAGSSEARTQTDKAGQEPTSFAGAIGQLFMLGLASPFLAMKGDPMNAGLGLLLVFFAVRYAWGLMAAPPEEVIGPFPVASPA